MPRVRLTLRYQYQVLRAFPKTSVFAQMLAGFEMASVDSRVVAINLVQSQDEYNALNDFDLQMHMLDYLHGVYPKVHISLHAGELTPGEVTPEELRASHIRTSIELGPCRPDRSRARHRVRKGSAGTARRDGAPAHLARGLFV